MSAAGRSKIIALTGAASGIGAGLLEAGVARGHRFVAGDIDLDGLQARIRRHGWTEEQVRARALDVRDPKGWRAFLESAIQAWGRLDVLLNVAGVLRPAYIQDATDQDIDRHLDINVKGVALGMREAARLMIAQRRGHIVNIGSLASLTPVPGMPLYAASKFAVRGLSLAAAQNLRTHNVAVSLVMPDAVQTPMLDSQVDYDEAALTFSGNRPLTVDEVADAVYARVFTKRPLELALPPSRGALARLANTVPAIVGRLGPAFERRGRRAQAKRRG